MEPCVSQSLIRFAHASTSLQADIRLLTGHIAPNESCDQSLCKCFNCILEVELAETSEG